MEMDYKIVEEKSDETGVYFQRVRYYTGAVTTKDEFNEETSQMEPVTRYRRTEMVEEVEYNYGSSKRYNSVLK